MIRFTSEGYEEFIHRIANIASNDNDYCAILSLNHIEPNPLLIRQAILSCDILVQENDIHVQFPRIVSRYVVAPAGRLADIIDKELGEPFGFVMDRK